MATTRYLTKLRGKPGWYFQRAVPLDIRLEVGKGLWRWKAGNTKPEAIQAAARFLAETDELIRLARGRESSKSGMREETRQEARLRAEAWLRGLTIEHIHQNYEELEIHTPYLPNYPQDIEDIRRKAPITLKTAEELLTKAKNLKKPKPSTFAQWEQRLSQFMDHSKVRWPTASTRDHARAFRDSLLEQGLSASTIKTRINYLSGLWSFMVGEEWTTDNIWSGITRNIKVESIRKEPLDIKPIDDKAKCLSGDHRLLYLLLRYTGMRPGEAAGLRFEDIKDGVINLVEHESRSLKTPQSRRQIPLHPELVKISWRGKGPIFPQFYSQRTGRWGAGLTWNRKIGIAPKDLRDHAKQAMREANIDRAISRAILGHKSENVGESYGGVTLSQMRKGIEAL